MLRRMNRKYTLRAVSREARRCSIATCRTGRSRPTSSSAFPGETDADFDATLDYVRDAACSRNAFMFVYSIRRGTPAARWEQVPAAMCVARASSVWSTRRTPSTRAYHDRKIGTTVARADRGALEERRTKLAAKTLDNVTARRAEAAGLRRSALRARTVARRRDRKRPRVGLHRHHRAPRRSLRRSRNAVPRPLVSLSDVGACGRPAASLVLVEDFEELAHLKGEPREHGHSRSGRLRERAFRRSPCARSSFASWVARRAPSASRSLNSARFFAARYGARIPRRPHFDRDRR